MEVEDRGLRVEVQQMLDTWDIEAQRRRTGARALVTVLDSFSAVMLARCSNDSKGIACDANWSIGKR